MHDDERQVGRGVAQAGSRVHDAGVGELSRGDPGAGHVVEVRCLEAAARAERAGQAGEENLVRLARPPGDGLLEDSAARVLGHDPALGRALAVDEGPEAEAPKDRSDVGVCSEPGRHLLVSRDAGAVDAVLGGVLALDEISAPAEGVDFLENGDA